MHKLISIGGTAICAAYVGTVLGGFIGSILLGSTMFLIMYYLDRAYETKYNRRDK